MPRAPIVSGPYNNVVSTGDQVVDLPFIFVTWLDNTRMGDKTDAIWVDGMQRRIGECFPVSRSTVADLKTFRVLEEAA